MDQATREARMRGLKFGTYVVEQFAAAHGHEHDWKYKTGQGRVFQCQDPACRQIGVWVSRAPPWVQMCSTKDCSKPATRISKNGFACKEHKEAQR